MWQVGIVGTGYAAKRRVQAFQQDARSRVVAVSGKMPERTSEFAQSHQLQCFDSWQELITSSEVDLVVICTVNRDHGAIARFALESGKHVIVEYPLCLDPIEGEAIINLAQSKGLLLHVEHFELLGGVHQAIKQALPRLGQIFYARYSTIKAETPAPRRWNYNHEMFGFPLSGALSRLHRLTDLFGEVADVTCQAQFWNIPETNYYRACFCNAQLRFSNEVRAEVTYGKGETFFQSDRTFTIYGEQGQLIIEGESGKLIQQHQAYPLEIAKRQGLFAKDTTLVLDYLETGKPLYISPQASLATLKVAEAARQSAQTNQH